MALQAITGLLFTTSCTKEKVQLRAEKATAEKIESKSAVLNTKKAYALEIARVFYEDIYVKGRYMPTLNFKGGNHKIRIVRKGTAQEGSVTFSCTTLTSLELQGEHYSTYHPHIFSVQTAAEKYFSQVSYFVSIEWMAELLNHLNNVKNDLPHKKLVTKQDYADEISSVLFRDIYMKNMSLQVFSFKGKNHICKHNTKGRTMGDGKRSEATFSFTTLTSPEIQGKATRFFDKYKPGSNRDVMEFAIQDYFNRAMAQNVLTIELMKDILETLNMLKRTNSGFIQSR